MNKNLLYVESKSLNPQNIALVRTDKIGDLVSTMPVDEAFKLTADLKSVNAIWIIDKSMELLAENAEPPRSYFSIDRTKKWQSFWNLVDWFRKHSIDTIIIFYAPWWISMAALYSGVLRRIGRRSQWHSFLFLNKGIRQSRSQSEKHEADYNWDLILKGLKVSASTAAPVLKLKTPLKRELFEKLNLQSKKYVVVHAGMAGSALNWPTQNYDALIEELTHKGFTVVMTGTKADEPWLAPLKPKWQKHPQVRWLQNQLDFNSLLFVLAHSSVTVAPSTGVAHLAASLGTRVVSLFPPITSQSEKRWGPRSEIAGKITVLKPAVDCPAKVSCLKEKCSYHPCMNQISVAQVLHAIESQP